MKLPFPDQALLDLNADLADEDPRWSCLTTGPFTLMPFPLPTCFVRLVCAVAHHEGKPRMGVYAVKIAFDEVQHLPEEHHRAWIKELATTRLRNVATVGNGANGFYVVPCAVVRSLIGLRDLAEVPMEGM